MRRQFTLFRLMASVTVFALLFGLTGSLWTFCSVPAVVISVCISASWMVIVLIAKKKDVVRIVRSVIGTIMGMYLTIILLGPFPSPFSPYFWGPFFVMSIGAIIGWCIAGVLSHWNDNMERTSEWDRQIEADVATRKLDHLAEEAIAAHEAGKTQRL